MSHYGEKKKKKPYDKWLRRRYYLIASIIIILAGLGLFALVEIPGVGLAGDIFETTTIDVEGEDARTQIEQSLKTTLPDSATNFYYYFTQWQDYFMQMRFDLSQSDMDAFLDNIRHLCFDLPLDANLMPFGARETKKTWWRPRGAEQFSGATCGDNPYWQMMIDLSNDETWIVYVIHFSA